MVRRIAASVERAYNAWAEAEEMSRWFTSEAQQDVRPGGRYSNADGDRGEYTAVEPNRLLAFTWE